MLYLIMSDKLVFDLASEVEGSPNVFIRKDWINILDNQNQNYNNNQSVLDTSQLSNSNKYMSYREAYLMMPLLLTIGQTSLPVVTQSNNGGGIPGNISYLTPAANPATKSMDYSIGLKNWFGQMIHSFTLDYNGTTIIQQTPFVNMWNSFKLLTSLSYNDVITQGATIGFYPDDPTSFQYQLTTVANPANIGSVAPASLVGQGTCNNGNFRSFAQVGGVISSQQPALNFNSGNGNTGFLHRQYNTNFDGAGVIGSGAYQYTSLVGPNGANGADSYCKALWKSYVSTKLDQGAAASAMIQVSITAIIYLKHIHSFFNMCPLLKGVFMKMTMNLNNCSTTLSANSVLTGAAASDVLPSGLVCTGVQNSIGGVNPIMIASASVVRSTVGGGDNISGYNGSSVLCPAYAQLVGNANAAITTAYTANVSVGAVCLNQSLKTAGAQDGTLGRSIYLYIPAYTFNPVFEQSYLSSPVKQIKYTDIYQYQVLNISGGGTGQFNNLLTNGIANIKSVLLVPFYSTSASVGTTVVGTNIPNTGAGGVFQAVGSATVSNNTGFLNGTPVWQSPFDPAGCGCTSPLISFSNMNVQISGQNAIYNVQKYAFEEFNNQLYGQNAVNGGMTDGLTSSLIDRLGFDMEYCYYYVNVERMLPVEQSVPKSVQILGTNNSNRAIDLYCFIEYGVDISIDALTGARV